MKFLAFYTLAIKPQKGTRGKKCTYHERSATFLHPFQGVSPFLLWAFAPFNGGESGERKWPSSSSSLFPFGATWHETQKLANGGGGGRGRKAGSGGGEESRFLVVVARRWKGGRKTVRMRKRSGRSVGGGDKYRKRGRRRREEKRKEEISSNGVSRGERPFGGGGGEGDFPPPSMESYVSGGTRRRCTTTKGEGKKNLFLGLLRRWRAPIPCHAIRLVLAREKDPLFCGWRRRSRMEKRGEGEWYGV